MHAPTATASTASTSYVSTSYHTYQYIQTPEDYHTSTPIPSSTNDPIILPPLPAPSNPVLATPHVSRATYTSRSTSGARRARTTSPSHLSRPAQPTTPSYHPYSKPSSPPRLSKSHSTVSSSPRPHSQSNFERKHKPTHDHASAQPTSDHAEPDPAQALNDLHYLSSLTAAQRAELYRRSRLPSSSSADQGWFSYLPSILSTLKSRLPTTPACATQRSTSRAVSSMPSTPPSLPTLPTFESYTTLTHLLASERLENAKLKKACEVLKRQVREVSARCCALEALGFGGLDGSGSGTKGKAKGQRGVKRQRDEEGEEGKRGSPSPMARRSTLTPGSAGKTKRITTSSPNLSTTSTTNAKRSPALKEPSIPRKHIEPLCPSTPYTHPSPPLPCLRSPISLSVSCDTATSSTLTASDSTSSSTLTASATSTSCTSTPSSLGLSLNLKPLKYDDEIISDTESLPTPSYLPIPFLSQQARSAVVPGVKSLYDTLVENTDTDTRVVRTAPATPEGKSTSLECPPSPPKRVKSAGGRIQSRAKVVKPKSTYVPGDAFEITPSPSPATAADEDEEQEKETARERRLLDLMFVNTGREIECRACRINTTYPRSHSKYISLSQIHTFIHGTTEKAYIAHLVERHAGEWGELKRLSEREVGLLRGRLGIPGSEKERVGYMDLATREFVRDVEEDVRRDSVREGMDEVPEVRPRKVDITPSHLIMRMAAKQREGMVSV